MSLIHIILWVVLFFFLVGFFVVVWKAARDWRWYNLVAVCSTMLLCVIFIFPTAGVLKSRTAWHQVREKLEVRAASVAAEQQALKYGDPNDPSSGEGLVSLDQQLSKLGIEAGRRWRNLQMQNAGNNNGTLNIVLVAPPEALNGVDGVPADADDAGAAPADPQVLVPETMVVYAFAETPNEQQILIPTFYLGEFRIDKSSPSQVTLVPTGDLEPNQLQAISGGQARSWSLYELLPLDGHQPFLAEGSVPSDENFFGRVDEELVRQLLAKASQESIDDYLRDGERANQDDPPLSHWTKIEFLKNTDIEVDSPDQQEVLFGGFFDGNGRAVDARLQRGDDGKVKFKKGDQILLKEEAAGELIAEGDAKLIDTYYLRPLNDYRFVLRRIRLRLLELANRATELGFGKNVLEEAIDKTKAMTVENQDIKLKLEHDLAQFRVEKSAIESYTTKLQEQLKTMRAEMVRLHEENQRLEQMLEEKHLEIERRLDVLTATQ